MAGSGDKREGRGRLSSIDLLPEEADEDIAWALEQLRDNRLPQNTILMEFNERLADKGMAPISKSAWNRYAVKKAIEFRKLDRARMMAAELNSVFDASSSDDVTILIGELIKVAMQDMLMEGKATSSKEFMELARSLQSVVTAQRGSAEYRERLQREYDAKLAEAARKVGQTLEGQKGVSKEALKKINEALLGAG